MTRRATKSHVNILGRKFSVTKTKLDGISGDNDLTNAAIRIEANQDEFGLKDTLLHEVMHGILFQQGRSQGGDDYPVEESYVRPLATGLIAFFRANPAVANWLISDPEAL